MACPHCPHCVAAQGGVAAGDPALAPGAPDRRTRAQRAADARDHARWQRQVDALLKGDLKKSGRKRT